MLPFEMILAVEIFIDRYGTEAGGSTHSGFLPSDNGPCFVAAALWAGSSGRQISGADVRPHGRFFCPD